MADSMSEYLTYPLMFGWDVLGDFRIDVDSRYQ